jgi:hypothetical protein
MISDPETLRELDQRGLDLAAIAFSPIDGGRAVGVRDNSQLAELASYSDVIDVLIQDLADFRQIDPSLGIGMRFGHRAFDPSWLSSAAFHFELVGVINRIDRRAFAPGTCGELRTIYRAAYRAKVSGQDVESRVPMTFNVVHSLEPATAGCQDSLRRWQLPELTGRELAEALLGQGGLLENLRQRSRLKSIEVNLQSARWPSTVRPNMAGHAEYLLRVFAPDAAGRLVPRPMENTPDVASMARPGALRTDLINHLSAPGVLASADAGTLVLPERYLADRVLSVAPHGLARGANRPFNQILRESDFADLDLSTYRTFKSPAQLLRRLDAMSCAGCHQTRSVAGFHFLGEDPRDRTVDALAVGHSPHLADDLGRRAAYLQALLASEAPDETRPSPERMAGGSYGARCGIAPGGEFADWTCQRGLVCQRSDDPAVGQCQPAVAELGDACESGVLKTISNPHRDSVRLSPKRACTGGVCQVNAVGFPGGMCSGACSDLPDTATCGGIALLDPFNACVARKQPFTSCLTEHTRPGALRKCSATEACRDDYVCARLPSGEGGCLPPYFLFQLRIDGHVID